MDLNADGFVYGVEKAFQVPFYLRGSEYFEHQSKVVEEELQSFSYSTEC